MKFLIVLCLIFGLQISISNSSERKDYTGYKTFRVNFTLEQVEELRSLVDGIEGTEFWLFSTIQGIADVFTSPNSEKQLLSLLKERGFNYFLLNGDVQRSIDESQT